MKIIKLLTFLVFISLQAGATGYAHNMFVAHKKLQAGKDCKMLSEQTIAKKATSQKVPVKVSESRHNQPEASFTRQFANKLSGVVTLNQRVLEEGPTSFFQRDEDKEEDDSIVTKLATVVKGMVYAFVASTALSKS